MPMILILPLSLLTLFYCIILLWLIRGLFRLAPGKIELQPMVSIVVAARNEEKNISTCLKALTAQQYPTDKYEVIIVDDRSEDRTVEIVKRVMGKYAHIRLVEIKKIEPPISPKKWALHQGISQAKGEIILTTDADCRVETGWIETTVRHFDKHVGLVAGYSPLVSENHRSLLNRFMALDALALAAVAAGSFGGGYPLTCNGRNLAYRKEAYHQTGGFDAIRHIISGDDDLFLHQMREKTEWEMRYAIEKQSVVSSIPPKNFKTFFHQKIRHASKSRYYNTRMKMGLVVAYLCNLSLLFLLFMQSWILFIIILGIKSSFEFLLLSKASKIFHQEQSLFIFPLIEILHIPYVVLFGALAQFTKFKWKETAYSSRINS